MFVNSSDESGFDPREYIPHRAPILGVDRILEIGEQSATTERLVEPGPDVCVDGYLWEEALIEGLAQTASALHGQTARREGRSLVRGLLVAVSHLTIHRRARVGERIQYRIDLTRRLEGLSLVHGIARTGDEVLAEGELKFYTEEVS